MNDFNKRAAYGYFMYLTWNVGSESTTKMNFEKMSSKIDGLVEEMNQLISVWVQNNPTEAEEISKQVVLGLNEFLQYEEKGDKN